MIKKLVKILPYFIVVKLMKQISADWVHTTELGLCRGWRVDKGEFLLYSEKNYKIMREKELKRKETRQHKKRRKLERQFRKDFELKQEAEKILDDEKRRRSRFEGD